MTTKDITKECNRLIKEEIKQKKMWFIFSEKIQKGIDTGLFWTIRNENELLGFVLCRKMKNNTISLDKIAVKNKGNGLGKELLDKVKNIGLDIKLDVVKNNIEAIKFYEREGFKKISEKQLGKKEIIYVDTMVYSNGN
jgi:ribosomal protein S18 acetylase RimI-like enzyme